MRTILERKTRARAAALCGALALVGAAAPAGAAAQALGVGGGGFGARLASVDYTHDVGATMAYGVGYHLGLVPIVDVAGSLEYATKTAHLIAEPCAGCAPVLRPYGFRDLAARVSVTVPVVSVPAVVRVYVGGGLGIDWLHEPDVARTAPDASEWATRSTTENAWHLLAGVRTSLPALPVRAFLEARETWIDWAPGPSPLRQTAIVLGVTL